LKEMLNKLFGAVVLASAMVVGASAVNAAPPNPVNGYTSVHDNILDKGANHGRCNAVGVLAAKVCNLNGALVPAIELVVDACGSVGVDLGADPEVSLCMEENCEVIGTC